ncbi:MAG TPA: hypothetical protein VGB81_10375, partial [Devosia sp.]
MIRLLDKALLVGRDSMEVPVAIPKGLRIGKGLHAEFGLDGLSSGCRAIVFGEPITVGAKRARNVKNP